MKTKLAIGASALAGAFAGIFVGFGIARSIFETKMDEFEADQAAPRDPVHALTGVLADAVRARGGNCLICGKYPALYCCAECAQRGR